MQSVFIVEEPRSHMVSFRGVQALILLEKEMVSVRGPRLMLSLECDRLTEAGCCISRLRRRYLSRRYAILVAVLCSVLISCRVLIERKASPKTNVLMPRLASISMRVNP